MNKQKTSIQDLEMQLGHLAAQWRSSFGNPDKQSSLVIQYSAIINELYNLGWDDVVDLENELPETLMPQIYRDRNPAFYNSRINFTAPNPDG